ncbi:hypothetical protein [Comamonas sp.]|uniref:hypothetical protein n=1 Tax=Comamonas sp. TaxID=34028 RepID=UPI0012C64806|nr:hypothetical protein [Comamonas sp.]MPS92915.1 hypothetical protein [Comamonas sp.]
MSASMVLPFHLAVVIQYSLIHRDVQNGGEEKSLASYFFKAMELKIKAQYLPDHTKIIDDKNISAFDKSLYIDLELNDFFDVDLYQKNNFGFLARLLCTSNFQALEDRYGLEYVKEMNLELITQIVIDKRKQAYKTAKELSFLQFIKLVDCIIYQCSEMHNYSNSLCKLLLDSLIYNIIRIQPEYSKMLWDLNEQDEALTI